MWWSSAPQSELLVDLLGRGAGREGACGSWELVVWLLSRLFSLLVDVHALTINN